MISSMIELTSWLIEQLDKKGWSQRELARRSGMTQSNISNVISENQTITFDFCKSVADALGISAIRVFRIAGLIELGGDRELVTRLLDTANVLSDHDLEEVIAYAEMRYKRSR